MPRRGDEPRKLGLNVTGLGGGPERLGRYLQI